MLDNNRARAENIESTLFKSPVLKRKIDLERITN